MARYHKQSPHPSISKHVIGIVDEAMSFMQSEFCEEQFKHPSVPPTFWRHVKIHSHRRSGLSYSALKLLNEYTSSLIVTHSHPASNHLRQMAIDNKLVPKSCEQDFYNNITFTDHVIPYGLMGHHWFARRKAEERHQLIILDAASMIETNIKSSYSGAIGQFDSMHGFRMSLWNVCDLLVELG